MDISLICILYCCICSYLILILLFIVNFNIIFNILLDNKIIYLKYIMDILVLELKLIYCINIVIFYLCYIKYKIYKKSMCVRTI
jgi:hypothetical protein